jgi:hypothetical protein
MEITATYLAETHPITQPETQTLNRRIAIPLSSSADTTATRQTTSVSRRTVVCPSVCRDAQGGQSKPTASKSLRLASAGAHCDPLDARRSQKKKPKRPSLPIPAQLGSAGFARRRGRRSFHCFFHPLPITRPINPPEKRENPGALPAVLKPCVCFPAGFVSGALGHDPSASLRREFVQLLGSCLPKSSLRSGRGK